MKKYDHPIDDFFRETLKDHEMAPSDAAKQAFLKDVMPGARPEKKEEKVSSFFPYCWCWLALEYSYGPSAQINSPQNWS